MKANAEGLPKEKQAGAVIRQWAAIKKKFGCGYKEVSPDNFVNIISLLGRLPLEGELLDAEPKPALPAPGPTLEQISDLIDKKLAANKLENLPAPKSGPSPFADGTKVEQLVRFSLGDLIYTIEKHGYLVIR